MSIKRPGYCCQRRVGRSVKSRPYAGPSRRDANHGRKIQQPGLILLFLIMAGPSLSANLDTLVQLLSPAYLAEHVAVVCTANDPAFATETSGRQGSMRVYAQNMKSEIIAGLDESEANTVLRRAADAAKAAALMAIRANEAPTPGEERQKLIAWCETSGRPFVRSIILTQDQQYAAFKEAVARAKSSLMPER